MKTACINYPCGVSETSDCCNAKIVSGDLCGDCYEHCGDACDECDEFDSGEDMETE